MNINQTLLEIKNEYENVIKTATFNGKKYNNGREAKLALIRSQKLINKVHELVKFNLVQYGIKENLIHPAINNSSGEITLKGFFKNKDQDITVIGTDLMELRVNGQKNNEKIISINVRSQLSSLAKNIDTLYERTFAEALNLHLENQKQCLGEVYLIPTHEYSDVAMLENNISFKRVTNLENYIQIFDFINNRTKIIGEEYKYERVCLLIVDFNREQPKIYNTTNELILDKLISPNTNVKLENLNLGNFTRDLMEKYIERFSKFPN